VRTVAKLTLERFGFTVLTANDGGHAIDVFRRHADEIRCVLLNLTMPVMSGEEVLLALRGIRTSVPVLLSSGYTEQEALSKVAGDGPTGFVQKPYRPQELIEKVRGILGEG